jgi:ParB-like nuclease domain
VPELERSSDDGHPAARNEELPRVHGDRRAGQREGLPRDYRMRADSHYVDQLESRYAYPAIRLIPTRQIAAVVPSSSISMEPLVRSISAHGVVQPLLVRAMNGGYQLIAGRKRLAAAIEAGVTDVPCLIYEVDDAQAGALAQADNVRAPNGSDQAQSSVTECVNQVLQALSVELISIGSSAALLRSSTARSTFRRRVTADLVQAQAWRAAWLASATAVVTGRLGASRARPIESILEHVKMGFEAEAKLTRLQLECKVAPTAASYTFDETLGVVAVTGCVLATLSLLEESAEPHVEVRAATPNSRALSIDVVQRTTPIPAEVARGLREPGFARSSDLMASLGLLTAKSVAVQHGGSAEFIPIAGRGSVIQSIFCRPNGN